MRKCPVCGREYSEPSALSRVDNETEICPECGIREALQAVGIGQEKQNEIIQTIREKEQGR